MRTEDWGFKGERIKVKGERVKVKGKKDGLTAHCAGPEMKDRR
jgi:hypothetical protein